MIMIVASTICFPTRFKNNNSDSKNSTKLSPPLHHGIQQKRNQYSTYVASFIYNGKLVFHPRDGPRSSALYPAYYP